MVFEESPLPIRQSYALPRPLGSNSKNAIVLKDDEDELAGDTVPCSPAAMLKDRDMITQPTQLLSRPGLNSQFDRSSSPVSSTVEVPASSPFQQTSSARRPALWNRLAPAGTSFRPPSQKQQSPPPQASSKSMSKRPVEHVNLLSDDDEDEEDEVDSPQRDIKTTNFKPAVPISSFTYKAPTAEERVQRARLRQIYDIFGNRFSATLVKEGLKACDNDVEATADWLERLDRQKRQKAQVKQPQTPKKHPADRRPAQPPSSRAISVASSSTPSPLRPPRGRRLVQGLRQRSSPSQFVPPSSDDPIIVDIARKEDTYQAEESPSEDESAGDKVLDCINDSSLHDLASMTGMKEDYLQPLLDKRPFADLAQARRVSSKKPGARKAARISVGEAVVEAVEVFLNAAEAIDKVVSACEAKAQAVRSVVEMWDVDAFGQNKRSARASPSGDSGTELPPTPTSLSSVKYKRPPIPRQPKMMDHQFKLKPFQLYGLNWLALLRNFDIGCILADEMGLGKTCQVISMLCHMVEEYERDKKGKRPWPNLIVVPPSTYSNWLNELEKFASGLSVVGYRGSQAERAELAYYMSNNQEEVHVVLATYSQLTTENDIEAMRALRLNCAVFDEGHNLKNPQTKTYRDLRVISADWKILLTGTPVQNNLLEMTSLLNFINPRMFDGYMRHIEYIFSQKVTIRDVSSGAFLYRERVERARTILEPFILQRRKDQVEADMPKKTSVLAYCEMTEGQKSTYDEYERLFRQEPSQRSKRAVGRQNDHNNVWMQLRKAAIHPLLFRRHFNDAVTAEMAKILMERIPQSELHQPDIKHLTQELRNASDFELHLWCRDYPRLLGKYDITPEAPLDSGKVRKVLELVKQYQENGDRVLVFSKFARVIELLSEVLAQRSIEYRVLSGTTSVAERQDLIDDFNNDPTIPVFLLTTGAGGTGINLTAANKVIIFDQSDNPQDDIQAENRAHRLGQKRAVEVVRLISTHTVEELIYKACSKKIELADKVTGAQKGEASAKEAEATLEKEVRMMMADKMTPPSRRGILTNPDLCSTCQDRLKF